MPHLILSLSFSFLLCVFFMPLFLLQNQKMKELTQADLSATKVAQDFLSSLNRIYTYNEILKGLYLSCQAAKINPAAIAIIKTKGEWLRSLQTKEEIDIGISIQKQRAQSKTALYQGLRRYPSPGCSLPGPLYPKDTNILKLYGEDKAGFQISYININSKPSWRFWHPKTFSL